MKTIVVVPNEKARKLGLKDELRVGWKCGDGALFFASFKNREAFNRVLPEMRERYGEFAIEDRAQ